MTTLSAKNLTLSEAHHPTYRQMPLLNLMETQPSIQLLQVFKAICKV